MRAAHAELGARRHQLQVSRNEFCREESAFMEATQRGTGEVAALRAKVAAEERKAQDAAREVVGLQKAMAEISAEVAVQVRGARECLAQADGADAARGRACAEADLHDEHAAVAVKRALSRLEADFAKERQVLQAQERARQ